MKSVFLSYSRQDRARARDLYDRLKRSGFQVWFDEESLLPGQIWEVEIKKAIQDSTLTIVLLSSRSTDRAGYAQKELRIALDFMDHMPEGRPYLIPVKLEECNIPSHLSHIHCGTLYDESDYQRLLKTLTLYAEPEAPAESAPASYAKYSDEIYRSDLLIVPGYGASGIRVGDSETKVLARLGAPDAVHEHDEYGRYLLYYGRGVDALIKEGVVTAIFLHGPGSEGHRAFLGRTPEGISVESSRQDVEATFGRPSAEGGNGVIDYWVRYASLGFGVTYATLDMKDTTARVRTLTISLPN